MDRWRSAGSGGAGDSTGVRPLRAASAALAAALLLTGTAAPGGAAGDDPQGDAAAADACLRAAVKAIQSRYEAVTDLSARFVQRSRAIALSGGTGSEEAAAGTVVFAKPGKMRWSYEEPEPSLMLSDGRVLWIYDPTLEEAQRLDVGEGYLSGAAIQFLLGEGDMLRDFRVRARSCGETSVDLELVPRQDATYEKLGIVADPRDGQLSRTTIVDLLGNVTEIAFSELRENQNPSDDVFRFEPPEGVDVIDLASPGSDPGP